MPERIIPEWAARVGAEVRDRAEQLPINERYLIDVTDLLQEIAEREAQRHRAGGVSADEQSSHCTSKGVP